MTPSKMSYAVAVLPPRLVFRELDSCNKIGFRPQWVGHSSYPARSRGCQHRYYTTDRC